MEREGLANLGQPGAAVNKSGWPEPQWPLACGWALLGDLVTEETLSSVLPRGPLPRAMILLLYVLVSTCAGMAGRCWPDSTSIITGKLEESVHVYRTTVKSKTLERLDFVCHCLDPII